MKNTHFVFDCELDGRNLIEASAGTGKTWNICWLYLRLLLERNLTVDKILVVTFTNAATAELRERIRKRIAEMLACLKGEAPADPFCVRLVEALQQRDLRPDAMEKRLDAALKSFDQAAIFTIHGFCQRALAGSAFSAGQAFELEVLPDDSEMLTEAVHDFWRLHVAGGDVSPALAAWLVRKDFNPDSLVPLLRRALAKPLATVMWPDGIDRPGSVDLEPLKGAFAAARACWRQDREAIVGMVQQAAQDGHLRSYSANAVASGATALEQYLQYPDVLAAPAGHAALYRASTLAKRKTKNGTLPSHRFFGLLEDLFVLLERAEPELELARLALLKRLLEQAEPVRQRKRERRLQSYDDILFNLYDALAGGRQPWLAAELRRQYPAALIDEFQDTDALQYLIFDTIYDQDKYPVFFVGDPKQAIYSFRNADLNVYFKAKEKIRARHTLKDNQRSTEGLIEALNALFQANPRAFMLPGLDYVPVAFGDKQRPPFRAPAESTANLRIWTLPEDEEGQPITRSNALRAAAEATADEIARLLASAARGEISIGERPLSAGDIAVLVRSHRQGQLVRQALKVRGIGSVELSQQSVYASIDAEELERVLGAILTPAHENQLRAALAAELIGLDADAIAAMRDDSERLAGWIERFAHYREIWLRHGIGTMLRHLLTQEGVSARMLRRPDGERRMTNLLHLADLLHQAAATQDSPDALLRWLAMQRRDGSHGEEAQLRLESDRKLVQIVTIHKSKGLEYEVVFCPFLWDGYQSSLSGTDGFEYHDEHGEVVLDMRPLSGDEEQRVRDAMRKEEAAESLRLIYVALTRAVQRCYLIAGCYTRKYGRGKSASESARSLLNWLVAGGGMEPDAWKRNELEPAAIAAAWQAVQATCPTHIELLPLPGRDALRVLMTEDAPELRPPAALPAFIPPGWRIGSFSGLMLGADSENAASDHDARFPEPVHASEPDEALRQDDILLFPRGAEAGNCMHTAFELCDFADQTGWEQAVEKALLLHPQQAGSLKSIPREDRDARLKTMMLRMMGDVVRTPLQRGIALNEVGPERRLTELEFFLPASDIAPEKLNDLLQSLGYAVPRLNAARLRGYLKGFIDLVFEHGGRYYILDWKSNHLGHSAADYGKRSMAHAMAGHGYHLQYLLYTVALNRYLTRRLPGYDYDTHFGGVLYLFVRGVRPGWKDESGDPCGSFFYLPERSVIERLDAALRGSPAAQFPSATNAESLTAC